ncbi:hypothetical protein EV137_3169 [Kribbella pratensis]|uniref:Uncharacterized protein n=1 Tax=Kribbella pratensis TaxID=2512112 RepID=A0ABY2FDC8_9ACTN|nr:hypothetical protein [Kribbella pratensis]TDW89375.1 hypothetical protein EV137_3169 [Kribbella pratensis]
MTDLKQRLIDIVEDVEAPSDLLDRTRLGGTRRVRRRRSAILTGTTFAAAALVGGAVVVPGLLDGRTNDQPAASPAPVTPAADDPYKSLMQGLTRGDLAGDKAYLDKVLATWRGSSSGLFSVRDSAVTGALRGDPKVYWAGNTPAGRIAIVAQHYEVHPRGNVKLAMEGVYTLVAFVADDNKGNPSVPVVLYPLPAGGRLPSHVASKGGTNVLVTADVGQPAGWSAGADAKGRHQYTPLHFKDGVSVLVLPASVDPAKLSVLPLQPR